MSQAPADQPSRRARSSLARRKRAEAALVVARALPSSIPVDEPGRTKPLLLGSIWRLIPALLIALALILTPVTCGAMAGPHSVYVMPPGMNHTVTSTQAAPHAHHHPAVVTVTRIESPGDRFISPVSAVTFVATGLVAVLTMPAPAMNTPVSSAHPHELSLAWRGRQLTIEPPPPRS